MQEEKAESDKMIIFILEWLALFGLLGVALPAIILLTGELWAEVRRRYRN